MPKVEIIETRDGSSSLFLPELNETYHSTHGALTESKYVFIEKGLTHFIQQNPNRTSIRILEIGFGTGLNPWLTAIACKGFLQKIEFVSLEKFPLESTVISRLNYKNAFDQSDQLIFDLIHDTKWSEMSAILPNFSLQKEETDIFDFDTGTETFDIVYYDAFAPSKQPEMWTPEIMSKMYNALNKNGIFVTYCAQGQFKRDLKSVGFATEELPGPPGKKEMTRGTKA